ncbi:hypothetical protein DICVIV_04814 [Dictyocaulus viviparus]|uniref:WD domain, G-beta repeat protein n=1 Tax=Dictyocaulus viviparus TaxID=29172 RepID=A0A0D8XWZ4_DICVI|nr:hypothetical protein DICVIV_04814 [Dictyocaulus viviparus]
MQHLLLAITSPYAMIIRCKYVAKINTYYLYVKKVVRTSFFYGMWATVKLYSKSLVIPIKFGALHSITMDHNLSLHARTTTKCGAMDKKIRILDTRSGEVLHEGLGHEGVKPQRAIFLKDGRIITTGFTKRSERLYALRTSDNLSQPVIEEELDTSNGVLFPLYDEDTSLIYLCGKGDCAIRYYEVNQEYPFVHYINTYTSSEPQRAVGFQCKRGVCSEENEINRIYKLTTKGVVDVLQFFVPRKSDLFQHDLYPDTRSTVPALSAEEFMEGKNAVPNTQPVNPTAAQAKPKVQVISFATIVRDSFFQEIFQVLKKANILSQLSPTRSVLLFIRFGNSNFSAETTPSRSYAEQTSPQISAPSSPHPQRQQTKRPVVDDDMGIVTMSQMQQSSHQPHDLQSPERETQSQMTPKQQATQIDSLDLLEPINVNLRSRADRDSGASAQTAGQRRAAAELERIRRDQARLPDDDYAPQRPQASSSQRMSVSSIENPTKMEDLLSDFAKMKTIMRQHERRIRILEEEIAEKNMSNAYSF